MLLNFRFANFRSFREPANLDLTPANVRDIPYSVLNKNIHNKKYKALSSCVIYGANASGKSNAILAFSFFRELILCGNITNQKYFPLDLLPCFCESQNKTMDFKISFIHEDILYRYALKLSGIKFLCKNSQPVINYEMLSVNDKQVFERNGNSIKLSAVNQKDGRDELIKNAASKSLLSDELFLTNGYKTLINTDDYTKIFHWFRYKLIIVNNVNHLISGPKPDYEIMGDEADESIKLSTGIINHIAKSAGINSTEIQFVKAEKDKLPEPVSVINGKGVIAGFIESGGTMKIINFLPLVITAMARGATLIVDELDSSLHPSAVFSIINSFHNNELNINQAQLIFTSYNPVYLKAKIFRRDEIKFTEKDDYTSRLYTLSDFKTSGKDQVKNSTDIMKNYLTGKYGAIHYPDFSDVIKEALDFNKGTT